MLRIDHPDGTAITPQHVFAVPLERQHNGPGMGIGDRYWAFEIIERDQGQGCCGRIRATASSRLDSSTPSNTEGSTVQLVGVVKRTMPRLSRVGRSKRIRLRGPIRPLTVRMTGPSGSGMAMPGFSVGSVTLS